MSASAKKTTHKCNSLVPRANKSRLESSEGKEGYGKNGEKKRIERITNNIPM